MVPKGSLLSGVAAKLLWLLALGLGVTANGSTLCLVRAGVPGPALLACLAGVASLPLGSFAGVAGEAPCLIFCDSWRVLECWQEEL